MDSSLSFWVLPIDLQKAALDSKRFLFFIWLKNTDSVLPKSFDSPVKHQPRRTSDSLVGIFHTSKCVPRQNFCEIWKMILHNHFTFPADCVSRLGVHKRAKRTKKSLPVLHCELEKLKLIPNVASVTFGWPCWRQVDNLLNNLMPNSQQEKQKEESLFFRFD